MNEPGRPLVPAIAFEELLVNALIHRDYFIQAPVRLFMFDDRVEIISPGCLPNHLTVEKILAGDSVIRNPILASFASKGMLPYRGLETGVRRALAGDPVAASHSIDVKTRHCPEGQRREAFSDAEKGMRADCSRIRENSEC